MCSADLHSLQTCKLTYKPTWSGGLLVSQLSRPSLRHVSTVSQFCLFKDQAVLLGKWFWRRTRSTRISKSLVSHQNRCNFIFSSSSFSSIRPGAPSLYLSPSLTLSLPLSPSPSLSLWPASLHSNNSTKWDRAHEVCCFSPSFCVALSDSPRVRLRADPSGELSLKQTLKCVNATASTRSGDKWRQKERKRKWSHKEQIPATI